MSEYVIFVHDDGDHNNYLLSRPNHAIHINLFDIYDQKQGLCSRNKWKVDN